MTQWLKPITDRPGEFHTVGVSPGKEVDFVPFYRLHRHTYGVYWDLFTPDEWAKKFPAYAASQEKQLKLQAATVGYAQPGEMQPETDVNFQGEDTTPVRVMDQPARRGSKWFSFDLPVDPAHPMILAVTYTSDEAQPRTFDILINGQPLKSETVSKSSPARFYDVEYPLSANLVKDKRKVTVRFQSINGGEIAAVCGLRMLRADVERQ
jgi:hypothetical protein